MNWVEVLQSRLFVECPWLFPDTHSRGIAGLQKHNRQAAKPAPAGNKREERGGAFAGCKRKEQERVPTG